MNANFNHGKKCSGHCDARTCHIGVHTLIFASPTPQGLTSQRPEPLLHNLLLDLSTYTFFSKDIETELLPIQQTQFENGNNSESKDAFIIMKFEYDFVDLLLHFYSYLGKVLNSINIKVNGFFFGNSNNTISTSLR